MKNLIILFVLSFFSFTSIAQSNDVKTETFKVEGNCGMCQKRIEDAAYIKGVKRADWNKEDRMLTVVYRASKTSPEAIQKRIAKAGHSTEKITATESDYKKLPECCQYKSQSCNH